MTSVDVEGKASDDELVVERGPDGFRCILESLPQLVWTAARDGCCDYVSRRLLDYLGVPEHEMLGRPWVNQLHADDRERALQSWQQAVETGGEASAQCRFRRFDGAYRWFDVRWGPLRNGQGEIIKWLGANTEIHESHEVSEQLRAERLRLTKMAAASPQILHSFRLGPDGQASFPYVSPSFAAFFGVPAEAVADDPSVVFVTYHADDMPALHASVEQSRRTMAPWQHEWRCRLPGRGEVWIEAYSMPVRDPDGGVTWHGSLLDITARKAKEQEIFRLNAELEERVRERTKELEVANRELEAFSYSVSHDLRAPLRTINGFAEALIEDFGEVLPPEAQRYLQTIRLGAKRMGQLIDDLLTFSRLSRKPLDRRTIHMRRLVGECLRELGHPSDDGTTEVIVGDLGTCMADSALVRQVWFNLLSNAFKYSRHKVPPTVEVGRHVNDAGEIAYFVRDNGTGFNMDYAHKLFRVFQRLHRDDEFEGTGVGLAIVHRIVTRHGGRVWAEARPGEGATFWFTLVEPGHVAL